MNLIPAEFSINSVITQDTYLVDGELKKWTGILSPV
jgi:glyceraldehyde-3-phosphate dehydrogenase (NADP+)